MTIPTNGMNYRWASPKPNLVNLASLLRNGLDFWRCLSPSERAEDIPFFVRHFAQFFARTMKKIESISSETMNALVRYPWPGKIREMQNVIERAVILSRGSLLHVPVVDLKQQLEEVPEANGLATLEEVERKHIRMFQHCKACGIAVWRV